MFELAKKASRSGPPALHERAAPTGSRVGGEPRDLNDRAHAISSFL